MPYNSTIRVRKKKCIECGRMDFIFSKGRCAQCAKIGNHKALEAKDKDAEDTESVTILKNDVDILFSRLIRLRAAAPGTGMCSCYICGQTGHYTQMQAMHYVHRQDSSLRYHPKNVRVGDITCNVYKDGNLEEYAKVLDAEEKRLSEWLYLEGKEVYKFSREELKRMIGDFSREINHLKKIKNLK
jgi:hypothetical protein